MLSAEADLNALDAKSGDVHRGSTLAGAARALIGSLDRPPLADQTQLLRAIGQQLSETMGGPLGYCWRSFLQLPVMPHQVVHT